LERSTGEQKTIGTRVSLEFANQAAVHILETMAFIHDDILPAILLQMLSIVHNDFIAGDDNREVSGGLFLLGHLAVDGVLTFFSAAMVQKDRNIRGESIQTHQSIKRGSGEYLE
jgi:hypothetical protein